MPEFGLRSGLISLVTVSSPSREFGCGVEGKLVSFNITVRKMRADVRAGKNRTGKCATGRSRTGKCRTGNLPVYESVIPEIRLEYQKFQTYLCRKSYKQLFQRYDWGTRILKKIAV